MPICTPKILDILSRLCNNTRIMCDFNLAWETYSFHSSKCAELENEFLKEMNLLNDMILNGKDNLESIFSHISKTKRVSRIKAFGLSLIHI